MSKIITIKANRQSLPQSDELVKMIKSTNGKFFTCTFIKKDGSVRKLNGRVGCHIGVKGTLNRKQKDNLVTVFDAKVKEYRMINVDTLQSLKCGNFEYKVV